MEGNSNQSGRFSSDNSEYNSVVNNHILLKLEENGFITPDEKAKELIKDLTNIEYLFALKLLFENPFNQFSELVLRNSLVAFVDPTLPFDYYGSQSVVRLELHLRVWVAVLEKILFKPMRLSKELRDKVYNSLAKFADIHKKTTQVIQEGINNNYGYSFNQFNQSQDNIDDEKIIKKRNYNVDFLLIHLRDTLHSLRDDETKFQEILRRSKELFKAALILPTSAVTPKDIGTILLILTHLRQGFTFKYPVASYYVDWRIMLIIQQNLFNWSGSTEKIISKKFQEMILMEYFWNYLEKEWIDVIDNSILESQSKFDEISNKLNKILKNSGNFLNDLAGNEPLALPNTLWFGILDLAQNLIHNSTRKSTYGLCYYLAIESLNRAPNSFIQFKAVELLFHLNHIDDQMFSMIQFDFDQYIQKLNENNLKESSEKFKNLLTFVKNKCFEDFNLLYNNIKKGKGKSSDQNTPSNLLGVIANEMICPISKEPTDQLCILKCQHVLSFDNLKKLKQPECPLCREGIEDNDIRYLPQNIIYKHLYQQLVEAGHIIPSIELKDSINNHDSDSDNSEVDDFPLTKKEKIIQTNKSNPFHSIFQFGNSRKNPIYQNAIKELNEKNYEKAEGYCKEFLKYYPKSYSMRCILAYTYRCLNNYKQAHLYLNEATKLKRKNPIAWYIYGEINFRQGNYNSAISDLEFSRDCNAKNTKIYTKLHILLGNSYFMCNIDFQEALNNFKIALQNDPNNYLCLKHCAYFYERQEEYLNALEMLDKLLDINNEDSLILCYYGEILSNMGKYNEAILYFTKANDIDPENIHNLIKRAITYYILREYNKALSDLNKVIDLDLSNSLAYYYIGLTYYAMEDINNSIVTFEKCIDELDPKNDLTKMQLYYLKYLKNQNSDYNSVIIKINHIPNIENDKSLLFTRCKIYIELKKYEEAKLDLKHLHRLYEFNYYDSYYKSSDISFIYLLQKYSDFWSYLCESYKIDNDFTELGIVDKFNTYMFGGMWVYFISNLINLNSDYQFQKNNLNSLSGQILSFKNDYLSLPKFYNMFPSGNYNIVWKINIEKIFSEDCYVKFIVKQGNDNSNDIGHQEEYLLKYKDVLKLEGLGWIEYTLFNNINIGYSDWIQLSIEAGNNSIDMQIDYVRFYEHKINKIQKIHFLKMGHLLPFHKTLPNVPEAFEDNKLAAVGEVESQIIEILASNSSLKKKVQNLAQLILATSSGSISTENTNDRERIPVSVNSPPEYTSQNNSKSNKKAEQFASKSKASKKARKKGLLTSSQNS
ncbi:hypothetical protein C1645_831583 [Glomus cerebriforme]|uniref:Uncharacterized protein n=1 Tax=Glomus cerebriforme TaxID=658196 RepID=A0A397SH87_9GLOM|nr:hypothetical protein C1645_831583 [Glomus cerebriforme]